MMIKKFKDILTVLKAKLKEIKTQEIIRELEIEKNKRNSKKRPKRIRNRKN